MEQPWHNVADCLPAVYGEKVLIYGYFDETDPIDATDAGFQLGFYADDGWCFDDELVGYVYHPTHWMCLPAIPVNNRTILKSESTAA